MLECLYWCKEVHTIAEKAEKNVVRLKAQQPYHVHAGGTAHGIHAALWLWLFPFVFKMGEPKDM